MNIFDFKFFTGVVEDIDDPRKLGRVRVRIHGLHSKKIKIDNSTGKGIPFDYVPWAAVMMPTTSASIHGFGDSHGLLPGSWVVGFSRDGDTFNDLVVIGTLQGRHTEENPNKNGEKIGFFGRDGKYPDPEFLDEPDVNRHTRNELGHKDDYWKSVPTIKNEELMRNIPIAGGGSWSEQATSYAAVYPYNHVRSGPSRHLIEFDETPGAERIAEFHGPSHTYREIHPDGSQQVKIVGNNYEIVLRDNNLFVQGALNITAVGNINILSQGDTMIESKGDTTVKAQNLSADVSNSASINAQSVSVRASRNVAVRASTGISINGGAENVIIQGKNVVIRGQKTERF